MSDEFYTEDQTTEQPEVETAAPEEAETTEAPVSYTIVEDEYLIEGTEEPMSRRQFIQTLFTEHDMSRRQIAEMLGLKSNQVYQATVNMTNSHHGPGRGNGNGSGKAEKARELAREGKTRPEIASELDMSYGAVYAATKSLDVKSARSASKRVTIEVDGEQREMSRPDAIRELAKQGLTRPQIREQLDVSYAVVWAATKNMEVVEARSNKVMVDMDDGRSIPRVEAIREYADQRLTRRQIADKLDLDYSVVWATTKSHPTYAKAQQEDPEEGEEGEVVTSSDEASSDDEELKFEDFTKAQLAEAVDTLELEIDTSVKKSELIELIAATDTTPDEIAEALGESDTE